MQQTNLQELEKKALGFPEQAQLLGVTDNVTLSTANDFLLSVKAMQKEINETFDPVIKKAHESHKEAINQKKKHEAPLKEAEKIVKGSIGSYVAEQERLRLEVEEEARKEREEALREFREAEEENKRKAQEAIEDGNFDEASKILTQEKPEFIPPPAPVVSEAPSLEGVAIKKIWKFRVLDIRDVPREYLKVDEVKIGKVVRTFKGEMNIPGIEVYTEDSLAARSGGPEARA